MSDLINGREMLKRYQEDLCYGIACKDCPMCTEDGGCRVEEWIDKFPSADRPQGEWIKDNLGTVICSECKRPRRDNRIGHVNFCNSCGARMKGADGNSSEKPNNLSEIPTGSERSSE